VTQKDRIHATITKNDVQKWKEMLREGQTYQIETFLLQPNQGDFKTTHHHYKICFNKQTFVKVIDADIELYCFDFLPFPEILANTAPESHLIGKKQ